MSYEVFCRGEHAYCVPMVATQSDGRRQPEIEADKLREEIKDRGFTFIEADTQIKLTCFATGEDGFEPTAEWSRITQALKERDELEERLPVNRDGNVVLWGDTQFVPVGDKPVAVEFTVEVLGVDSFGNWYSMMSGEKVYLAGCHSTAESCAAHEKGE